MEDLSKENAGARDKEHKDSFEGSFWLPPDASEWAVLVKKGKLKGKTINNIVKMCSGSKILKKQFLMLRILVPAPRKPFYFMRVLRDFGLEAQIMNQARQIADSSSELRKYLELVRLGASGEVHEHDNEWAGGFMPAYRFQRKCLDPPPRPVATRPQTRSTKRRLSQLFEALAPTPPIYEAEDEAIANTALLLFLDSLATLFYTNLEWTIRRLPFRAQFHKAHYNALTDGGLRVANTKKILGIIEVKKVQRVGEKVVMQEGSEIVGWHLNQGNTAIFNNHRLLVSQNANQIYLTFSRADARHDEYLRNTHGNSEPFLNLFCFGPWLIDDADSMEEFALICLAIMLVAQSVP